MQTLYLRLDAPFAAYRWLQAGVYRASFPVIPPTAAWGLALNLAGIESRGSLNEVVTPIRRDAPELEIAVGLVRDGERNSLYQQLHTYPVGASGKELQARTKGAKYWIAPARREVICGMVSVVGIRGEAALLERIPLGLAGALPDSRYGLPFAGDNQYLFSRIDVLIESPEARWLVPLKPGESPKGSTRLTTWINREDSSRTQAPMFAPGETGRCPEVAWVRVGPKDGERD